jgi:uncharacterized membrane protein YphA (DoxX/SURF4 family)
MNLVQQIIKWEHPRHKILVLVLRVILGIIITFKGVVLINNFEYLDSLLRHRTPGAGISFWIYYIVFAHLLGGIFIIVGLVTRVATLIQVPILAAAVFFINPGEHGFVLNGEFALSLLVLCMLFYFLFKGAGEISMDNYLKNHEL